jgi:hypothetical protein
MMRTKLLKVVGIDNYGLAMCLAATLSFGLVDKARATSLLLDGTFSNSIGTGLNLTPWSDWTAAGITRLPAPFPVPGNYASLPVGADLFQRFSPLTNGNYRLSFLAQNQAPWTAELVFAIQQPFGTPPSIVFGLGTAKEISLPASSAFIPITLDFTIDNPPFTPNELTFSNSYAAPVPPIENSINRPGTIINIANIALTPLTDISPAPLPEPASWLLMLAGFGSLAAAKGVCRKRR